MMKKIFEVQKPIIGMIHLKPLPTHLKRTAPQSPKKSKNISPFPSPDAPEGFITTASYAPTVSKENYVRNVPITE